MSTTALKAAQPLEHGHEEHQRQDEQDTRRRFTALPRLAPHRGPKLAHGVVALMGLVAIIVAQLVMSVVLSEGAYELRALQLEQAQVARTEQQLQERVSTLESPQSIAMSAEALGMENGEQRQFIDLASGEVLSGPDGLLVDNSSLVDRGSGLAVPNELVMSEAELNDVAGESAIDQQRQREESGYPGMLLPAEGVANQE